MFQKSLHALDLYRQKFGPIYGSENFAQFVYTLALIERPNLIVELGTGYGTTSLWLAAACRENRNGCVLSYDDGSHFDKVDWESLTDVFNHSCFGEADSSATHVDSYKRFLENAATRFGLSDWIDFREMSITRENLVAELPRICGKDRTQIDCFYSDYLTSIESIYFEFGLILPFLSPEASLFFDCVPTRFELLSSLRGLIALMNAGKIPPEFKKWFQPDHIAAIRDYTESHDFTLVHLVERGYKAQNSCAWIKCNLSGMIPFDSRHMYWG